MHETCARVLGRWRVNATHRIRLEYVPYPHDCVHRARRRASQVLDNWLEEVDKWASDAPYETYRVYAEVSTLLLHQSPS
jgi:hypothetical protein